MTPSERSLVQHVGVMFLNNLARLAVYTFLYGVFIFLSWISARISIQRGLNSRPKWTTFGVTLTCFVLASLFWSAYFAGFVIQMKRILMDGPLPDATRLEAINREIFPLEELQYWTLLVAPLIGDSMVIWRAWVILGQERWFMLVPLALLLGTAGTSLTYAVVTSKYATIVADQVGHNQYTTKLYNSFLALSLATNATTTLLILYKLWTLRRLTGEFTFSRPSRVQKVLVVIVESGVAFGLLQVISLILNFLSFPLDSPSYVSETCIVAIYTFITPMYPTLVVVLVNQQSTIVETFGFTIAAQEGKAAFDIEIVEPPIEPGKARSLRSASMDGHVYFDSSPADTATTGSSPSEGTRTCVGDGNRPSLEER
ncbi:hypothetical protein LshimejAT787_1701680 [Lyophyllum shimeji]|uniref:Uncharacterized protein n=1 Tax=Lyophyllum shimeji TaxID=47721 RepID=A0A9P3PZL9_LYOSH|nr:hypothetical protein LshimejAT787_1701680 [Lyophyllum shimeji]